MPVIVRQEGSALSVSSHLLVLAEAELAAGPCSQTHDCRQAEQDRQDNKGKDPLERDELALELSNAQRCSQDAKPEANSVVLVGCQFVNPAEKHLAARLTL